MFYPSTDRDVDGIIVTQRNIYRSKFVVYGDWASCLCLLRLKCKPYRLANLSLYKWIDVAVIAIQIYFR